MKQNIAASPMPELGMIDMTRTMPPFIAEFGDHIRDGLAHVAARQDLTVLIQRHRFFGSETERETAAAWLSRRLLIHWPPALEHAYSEMAGTHSTLLQPRQRRSMSLSPTCRAWPVAAQQFATWLQRIASAC